MLHRSPIVAARRIVLCLFLAAFAIVCQSASPQGVIENRGQLDNPVLYYGFTDRAAAYFTREAVVIDLPDQGHAVWMRFDGGSKQSSLQPRGEQKTRLNYFLGNDPKKWRSSVPVYDELLYRDVWQGIDLLFRLEAGQLRYEIVAQPGVDLQQAQFLFQGIDRLIEMPEGQVRLDLPQGFLVDSREDRLGIARILRWGESRVGGEEDSNPWRDDPSILLWGTFLGGGDNDYPHGLTLDPAGNPVVTGYTRSGNFPTTPGAYDRTQAGSYDVFVAKLDVEGSALLWATFIGGSGEDRAFGVVLDHSGNPVFAGLSYSAEFPTTPWAYDRDMAGNRDAFVAKLNSAGSILIWSTFLGGSSNDRIWDVALDDSERPVAVGETYSSDFPTTDGAYDRSINGGPDGFVTKLNADGGGLAWSTFVGGSSADQITRVVLNSEQQIIGCGNSLSSNYPTTPGAFDETQNGDQDCIVSTLDPSGTTLLNSTFLGGEGADMGNVLAVDLSGNVVVTGSTTSLFFPVTDDAYDTTHNGDKDIFVTRLTPDRDSLVWSTYLGGSGVDEAFALVLDGSGFPILSGGISSPDFPTTPDAFDQSYSGGNDTFLTALHSSGTALIWSSYLGGTSTDSGWELILDDSDNPILAGPTRSSDFPTTAGAYDRSHNGGNDVFLLSFDLRDIVAAAETIERQPVFSTWPNPFRQSIEVRLDLPVSAEARIYVLDSRGRRVATVPLARSLAGIGTVSWDGRDMRGRPVPSGVYWLRVAADRMNSQQKIIHIR